MSNKEEGTANAYYQMAQKYKEEKREDKEQMILYYIKAAEQGHATAQYVLGLKYGFGNDVPQDLEKAIYWMSLAAEQEYDSKGEAHKALARLYAGKTPAGGCYVATCVYGSYDCPEVWTLRRFRDNILSDSWFGRCFINIYYIVGPKVVNLFGNKKWFNGLWKPILDKFVRKLQNKGIYGNPYSDM